MLKKTPRTCGNCKKVYHRKDFYQSHIIICNGNSLPVKSHDLIKKKNHRSNRASGIGQLDEINLGCIVKIPEETQQVSMFLFKEEFSGLNNDGEDVR